MDEKMKNLVKKTWGFWYGPDIIRGPEGSFFVFCCFLFCFGLMFFPGKFYVVEDNIGYVGGIGDLYLGLFNFLFASLPFHYSHHSSSSLSNSLTAPSCIREKFPEYSPHLSSLCSEDSSDIFFKDLCEVILYII